MDLGALVERTGALEDRNPIPAPATETYAIVAVDLGAGVNTTPAALLARVTSMVPADKSLALFYSESSYGKYAVDAANSQVFGPVSYSMTTCDTTPMANFIESQSLPELATFNHVIYYFSVFSPCAFGALGEVGSVSRPARRTWLNGNTGCVAMMQEPGHNFGLMHANSMKCGTAAFSTTPATSCTITEFGSVMSTMGGGCRTFNAYERWYMQWLSGCNGVRVPGSGTFNLLPLETPCTGGVQVLQIPFPTPLVVSDPEASATTMVTLRNYYAELRVATGSFDTYSATTFTSPTVFIYVSDDVHASTSTSVWTELLNLVPSGTTIAGLTSAGQSFTDPATGATITLTAISATPEIGVAPVSTPIFRAGAIACVFAN